MPQAPANLPTSAPVSRVWERAALAIRSWKEVLDAAVGVSISFHSCKYRGFDALGLEFISPRFTTYRAICNHLETIDYIVHATECFHGTASESAHESDSEHAKWVIGELSCTQHRRHLLDRPPLDFKSRCSRKLVALGDLAMSARQHDTAISQYSVALSLNPTNSAVLVKRSKACANMDLWDDALNDANEVPNFFTCSNRSC